jgi:AraC-like DNA-binding protein
MRAGLRAIFKISLYFGCNGNEILSHMQISPSSNLLPFIKHYLFLDHKEKRVKTFRLFSDGNTGIVFSLNCNLLTATGNNATSRLPNAFVYGQLTRFLDLYLAGEESLVIIVFQPSGLYEMMNIPADELRDNIIPTEDLFGPTSLLLREKLFDQSGLQQKLDLLNTFFTKCVLGDSGTTETLIRSSIKFIIQNKGLISIGQLVKYTGYTERHIERKFNESIGLNPKRISSIIKLHYFLGTLKTRSGDFTQMGYEAGYFDQSHLIREFKKYTGMTPKHYVMANDKLTINFVELSRK